MAKKKALNLTEDYFHCPTLAPREHQYLVQKARDSAKTLVESARSAHGPVLWTEAGTHKGVQMFKGAPRHPDALPSAQEGQYVCGAITIQATIEEVAEFMDLSTTPKVKEFVAHQDDLLDGVVLYTLVAPREENQFLHQITVKWTAGNVPSPVIRDRDFLTLECQDVFTDTSGRRGWVRSYHSVKLPCCPDFQSELGFVRGSFYHTGYVFVESERPGFLDCIHTFQINLKGNIILPSAVYYMAMKRRIGAVGELEKALQERRLGKQAFLSDLELVPKSARVRCNVCAAKFGMITRKSRCRKCGEVVCHECSQVWSIRLPKVGPKKVRVCARCYGSDGPIPGTELDNISLSSDRHSASMGSDHPQNYQQQPQPPTAQRREPKPMMRSEEQEMYQRHHAHSEGRDRQQPPRREGSYPYEEDPRGVRHHGSDPYARGYSRGSSYDDRPSHGSRPSALGPGGPPRYDRYYDENEQGSHYSHSHHPEDYHNRVGPPSRDSRQRGEYGYEDPRNRGFQHYPPRHQTPPHSGGYPPDPRRKAPGYGPRATDETGSSSSSSRTSGNQFSLTAHALEQHTRSQQGRESSGYRSSSYGAPEPPLPPPPHQPPYYDHHHAYPPPPPQHAPPHYYRDGVYARDPPGYASPDSRHSRPRGPQEEGSYGRASYVSEGRPPAFRSPIQPTAPLPPPPQSPRQTLPREPLEPRETQWPPVVRPGASIKDDSQSVASSNDPEAVLVSTLAENAKVIMKKQEEIMQQLEEHRRSFLTDNEDDEEEDDDREYGVDDLSNEPPALVEKFGMLMRPSVGDRATMDSYAVSVSSTMMREPQLSFTETVDIDVTREDPELENSKASQVVKPASTEASSVSSNNAGEETKLSVVQLYQKILELTKQQHALESNPQSTAAEKDAVSEGLRDLYKKLDAVSGDAALAF